MNIEEIHHEVIETIQGLYSCNTVEIQHLIGGLSTQNYLVLLDGSLCVLKHFHNYSTETISQLGFLRNWFSNHDLPVVLPLVNKQGTTSFAINEDWFELFPYISGSVLHEGAFSQKAFHSTAQLLAKFHSLPLDLNLPLKPIESIYRPKESVFAEWRRVFDQLSSAKIDDHDRKLLQDCLEYKRACFEQMDFSLATHPESLVHGDFHNENLLFNEQDHVIALFDFEETHAGKRVEDLFDFINFSCWNTGLSEDHLRPSALFIKEYHNISPLTHALLEEGITLLLQKLCSRFFLEKKICWEGQTCLIPYIARDLKKITDLINQRKHILEDHLYPAISH